MLKENEETAKNANKAIFFSRYMFWREKKFQLALAGSFHSWRFCGDLFEAENRAIVNLINIAWHRPHGYKWEVKKKRLAKFQFRYLIPIFGNFSQNYDLILRSNKKSILSSFKCCASEINLTKVRKNAATHGVRFWTELCNYLHWWIAFWSRWIRPVHIQICQSSYWNRSLTTALWTSG